MVANNRMARLALRCCSWSERWVPDAYVFSVLAVVLVVAAAVLAGASPMATARAFGDGYWSLMPFTMQMVFLLIGGHAVASSAPLSQLIDALARRPRSGRGAVGLVAITTMLLSLVHWGIGLVVGARLVQALGRRQELPMDYRAATAAAYLGLGAVWALGLSSSAAQLQANPASMSPQLLAITGVIPFSETIFLWQSMLMTAVIVVVSTVVAVRSAPGAAEAVTATQLGFDLRAAPPAAEGPRRPAEWLERSPLLNLLLFALGAAWLAHEFASRGFVAAIANLNTYNFLFLMLALLLQWRPRQFLDAAYAAVPSASGIIVQFPLYAGIAAVLTGAKAADGSSLAQHLAQAFASIATPDSFPVVIGSYSAVLGFLVPSGGGKWLIEAPYVMQAANELKVHLGWAVQVYNAAEALPNLINPLFMLPLLGIIGLKTRDIIGFTFIQFLVHLPVVMVLLWALGLTLDWHPPVLPAAP